MIFPAAFNFPEVKPQLSNVEWNIYNSDTWNEKFFQTTESKTTLPKLFNELIDFGTIPEKYTVEESETFNAIFPQIAKDEPL